MKQTTKMSRAVSQLEHIYSNLNADFFDASLPVPIITVQSKPGTFGHCTTAQIWKRKEDCAYELNIAAEVLNFPIEEIIDTLLHEMVHLYCQVNHIQDTSRGGTYHNCRFKEEAEKRGLTCYKMEKYGWNTKPNDTIIDYALQKGWSEICIARNTPASMIPPHSAGSATTAGGTKGNKRPSSTRKLLCPSCGQSVRATREVNILCGDCMCKMMEV